MDLSQVVPYILVHARWIGPALLGAGLLVRFLGKFISRALFVAGLVAVAAIAYGQWQAGHGLLWSGGILVAGLIVFGLLAWTIRGVSFVFAFALLAGAFYLIMYGWVGASFANSTVGAMTWAGSTIVTMTATGLRSLLLRHAATAATGVGL